MNTSHFAAIRSEVRQLCSLIRKSHNIVALTGAGISTNAGIPDFRGPEGLYVTRRYDPDTIFDIHCFLRDPKPFYDFARDFINLEAKIKPTLAHYFLSELERHGRLAAVITQNIDILHQRAGSKAVFELHGSFLKSHCLDCKKEFVYEQMKEKIAKEKIPLCSCNGVIKPDVVFYGEAVHHLPEVFQVAREADLFLVIGTSCVVYPAAMIPSLCLGQIAIINRDDVPIPCRNVVLSIRAEIDQFFSDVKSLLDNTG